MNTNDRQRAEDDGYAGRDAGYAARANCNWIKRFENGEGVAK